MQQQMITQTLNDLKKERLRNPSRQARASRVFHYLKKYRLPIALLLGLILFLSGLKANAQIGIDCSDPRPQLASKCSIAMHTCVDGPSTSTCTMAGGICCEGGVGLKMPGKPTSREFDPVNMFHVHFINGKAIVNIPGYLADYDIHAGDEIVTRNWYRVTPERLEKQTRRKYARERFHIVDSGGNHRIIYTK